MPNLNSADSASPRNHRLLLLSVIVSAVAALLVNIFTHKQEARNPYVRVVELTDQIDDPAVWGKQFPMEYDLYRQTVDMQRTRYGGSEGVPHSPTAGDPRAIVSRSKLEADPRLKTMWAGYSFSADYREKRG